MPSQQAAGEDGVVVLGGAPQDAGFEQCEGPRVRARGPSVRRLRPRLLDATRARPESVTP